MARLTLGRRRRLAGVGGLHRRGWYGGVPGTTWLGLALGDVGISGDGVLRYSSIGSSTKAQARTRRVVVVVVVELVVIGKIQWSRTREDGCLGGKGVGLLGRGRGGTLQRSLVAVDILAKVRGLLARLVYCPRTRSTIRCTASPSREENWASSVVSCSTQRPSISCSPISTNLRRNPGMV
jgi:hypothetical protein